MQSLHQAGARNSQSPVDAVSGVMANSLSRMRPDIPVNTTLGKLFRSVGRAAAASHYSSSRSEVCPANSVHEERRERGYSRRPAKPSTSNNPLKLFCFASVPPRV